MITVFETIIEDALKAYHEGAEIKVTADEYVLVFRDDMWTHSRHKKHLSKLMQPENHTERCSIFDFDNRLIDTHWKVCIRKEKTVTGRLIQLNDIMRFALSLIGKEE